MFQMRSPAHPEALPRPERVFGVTLLFSAAYLPLVPALAWQVTAFLALVLLLRLASLLWPTAKPGRLVLAVLMLAGIANCLIVYRTPGGQSGGSALFVTMLGLKLLEIRGTRDLRLIWVLLWFLIVVNFLFGESFALALFLGAVVTIGIALQLDIGDATGRAAWHRRLRLAVSLVLQAAPLTLILFFLFPRLTSPLWNLGIQDHTATTGMSDRLELGDIGRLVLSDELAFRAFFDTSPPAGQQLYWRGPVLWDPGARGWYRGREALLRRAGGRRLLDAQDLVAYEVSLEPSGQRWMFALDIVTGAPEGGRLTSDFQLTADRKIDSPLRYRAVSALRYRTDDPPMAVRQYALRLPSNVSERVRSLAKSWRGAASSDWEVVQLGLRFFNTEDFHYTLVPPLLGENPVDEFLFETRRGFCEHFASSFAVLMRAAGVPSRLVTGYLGGEPNPFGGYYMIWQMEAHAWVEVLIAGRGWVRVDPTAAVDPSRVDNRAASELLDSTRNPAHFQLSTGRVDDLLRQLRWLSDSIQMAWRGWVIDFSAANQWSVVEALGFDRFRSLGLLLLLFGSAGLVTGLILWGLLREPRSVDPVAACFEKLCRRLAAVGLERQAHEGPMDFVERVIRERPELSSDLRAFLTLYLPARYSATRVIAIERELQVRLKKIRPRKRRRILDGS